MTAIRILTALAISFSCLTSQAMSQDTVPQTTPQISFKFERAVPGVLVPYYIIELRSGGSGLYHAEIPGTGSPDPQKIDRPLAFASPTLKTAFELLDTLQSSKVPCASKLKNIADSGTKTLTYRDPKGNGSCTYNYSENKAVAQLTELFQAIEMTLEEGRSLDFKHRFDRLGLDAEISILTDAAKSGRARELGNIAPTLRSIAGDTELIERVRLRAAKLLEGVEVAE